MTPLVTQVWRMNWKVSNWQQDVCQRERDQENEDEIIEATRLHKFRFLRRLSIVDHDKGHALLHSNQS